MPIITDEAPAADYRTLDILGWAVTDKQTQEAYRKCTGEDAGPVLDRYVSWARENIIGGAV
ncbi:hypothetical protein EGT36_03260 [Agrobacterium sp. FDAARGOS_525]|nr:hypothetical protein EGT36_03260 [Agrobacterium sp. FDAARGOS_525]